jgi:membrane protein implicated in regulation of membrane protease activity
VKSEQPLPEGSAVLVEDVEGVMLKVRPR